MAEEAEPNLTVLIGTDKYYYLIYKYFETSACC